MKTGDLVRVNDGSWTFEIVKGQLVPSDSRSLGRFEVKVWTIVTTGSNLCLPTYEAEGGICSDSTNDTIITEGERIVFIQSRFLDLVGPCPYCGRD